MRSQGEVRPVAGDRPGIGSGAAGAVAVGEGVELRGAEAAAEEAGERAEDQGERTVEGALGGGGLGGNGRGLGLLLGGGDGLFVLRGRSGRSRVTGRGLAQARRAP
ncbi:hypothetical protein ASF32_16435 [Methylobacterium sp. Leaf91]|nr:hypothetical protein ASF32_16435 [Methylobacterium sp. Leaf91]